MTFHELYTGYYHKALRFVKSYVHDTHAAQDIVSESLIAVWRAYDPSRCPILGPLLFKVLRNRSLDYLKSARVRLTEDRVMHNSELDDLDLRLDSLTETDENTIFSTEINEIVRHTLSKMPDRTRRIFICSRVEGKTYLEISRQFDISDKGVEYHISSAVRLLREALKDYMPALAFPF